jgi:hypothetical protein
MTKSLAGIASSVLIGVASVSFPVLAQQQTLRACREEWRANQVALRANGITQKAYVADCQTAAAKRGAATTGPAAADAPAKPAAATAAPPTPATAAGSEKIKACQEEWRAKRAADELPGMTEKAYVEQCRSGSTPPAPSAPTTK